MESLSSTATQPFDASSSDLTLLPRASHVPSHPTTGRPPKLTTSAGERLSIAWTRRLPGTVLPRRQTSPWILENLDSERNSDI